MRLVLGLALLSAGTLALFACGSSSSSTNATGSGGTTSTTTESSPSSSTGSPTSTTGTGGSASTGGGMGGQGGGQMACLMNCINMSPMGFAEFEQDELKECGCMGGVGNPPPCTMECTMQCMNPMMMIDQMSPCGQCLLMEAAKKTMSMCTVKAALTDCSAQMNCPAFLACAMGC